MSEDRWERVKYLLHRAMQLAPEQRNGFLQEACPGDDSCRAEVESLLAAHDDARSDFMNTQSGEDPDVPAHALAAGELFEERFRLVRKLGEGGMGQVWMAEQLTPVKRPVALKLIRAGMYDESVVQRFLSERQSIAMMDHPAIAKVFEAGTSEQGQPYFVMEYVPGLPINVYCDQQRLTLRARLGLFVQACEGVQHAHQKAMIHRDLKPANILVLEVDGKPVPRIIDFGLAKPTNPELLGDSDFTLLGHFVGTPGYISPEQANPLFQDIDTRSDVYSLGVVLYVLLTGRRPFDPKPGERQPLDVLLRKLREEDPPAPSAKLGTDRDALMTIAQARAVDPRQLVRLLRGDLDWIALRALERVRSHRYGAPSELAADIGRYLHDEPVIARPASAAYRLRKYSRRHRVAVGIGAGLVVLLTAFSVLQGLELRRTTLERDRANRERDRAARITDFVTGIFKVPDPSEARGNSVTAREILDKASAEIGTGLAHDAEAQAQMLHVMASTYLNLGLFGRARELAERALSARERTLGAEHPDTLASRAQLGWILDRQGHDEDAEPLERKVLEQERRVLGPQAPLTLETLDHLSVIDENEGHYQEAENFARQVMSSAGRVLGPQSSLALSAANHFARALWFEARYEEAEQQYRRLLQLDRQVFGPDHPQTLAAMISLAVAVAALHRVTEAERLYREVLSAQQRVLGPEHQYTLLTMENLAALLTDEGHLTEGERLHREVLAIRTRTLGNEHPETLTAQLNLADVLLKEGRIAEADVLQRQTLAVQQRVMGAENPTTLVSESNLAGILIREHRYEEAEALASAALEVQVRTLGQGHPESLDTLRTLGKALAYLHQYEEASRLFHSAIERMGSAAARESQWSAWYDFACVAVAANQDEDALRFLRQAVDHGYTDVETLMADDDLKGLRRDARFLQLVSSLKTASGQGT
jgi:eukaryotic-like serine/threonine-protein kinase